VGEAQTKGKDIGIDSSYLLWIGQILVGKLEMEFARYSQKGGRIKTRFGITRANLAWVLSGDFSGMPVGLKIKVDCVGFGSAE